MIRVFSTALARACLSIGGALYRASEAFESLGDRINRIGVKRVPPSEINQIVYGTLEAHSEEIASSVIRNNALLHYTTKTVGGIDRKARKP